MKFIEKAGHGRDRESSHGRDRVKQGIEDI